MKLLMDTHAFLWLVEGHDRLSSAAAQALTESENAVFPSVASVWELSIKSSRQSPQLRLNEPLDAFLNRWIPRYQIQLLPVDLPHALEVCRLPHHHSDPFDRLLIAQAQVEGLTLVSADRQMKNYNLPVLW